MDLGDKLCSGTSTGVRRQGKLGDVRGQKILLVYKIFLLVSCLAIFIKETFISQ